jgi:hypothetical protein
MFEDVRVSFGSCFVGRVVHGMVPSVFCVSSKPLLNDANRVRALCSYRVCNMTYSSDPTATWQHQSLLGEPAKVSPGVSHICAKDLHKQDWTENGHEESSQRKGASLVYLFANQHNARRVNTRYFTRMLSSVLGL